MRQRVVYYPHTLKLGSSPPTIEVDEEPQRVWTLFANRGEEANPPALPISPRHNVNAFLEDKVHDWNWKRGKFRYASRVCEGRVWLLLEYED